MSGVALISNGDCGRHDTGWGHPEHAGRLRAIPKVIREDFDLFQALDHREGRHATIDELALAHDREYVESVRVLAAAGGGRLDADTVVSEGSWDAATAGCGSVLDAVDLVMDGTVRRAFCAVRPPGHHALRAAGMGFCLFGNVGVAAFYARAKYSLERVLIVDWDVHHGNGTQDLVEHEPGIRLVSMHQWPWYPGSGAAEDRGASHNIWNVPMPAGLPAGEYLAALESGVAAATRDFTPELVILSSGFDSMLGDPLGGFTLELDHIARLTHSLCARADEWCDGRLVSALEGGYDPMLLAQGCVTHLNALLTGTDMPRTSINQ
jgi:acetoin utilization deacetylase AcuC-like enzyme